jgi:hypothetical protein
MHTINSGQRLNNSLTIASIFVVPRKFSFMQLIIQISTEENQLAKHFPDQLAENIQPKRKTKCNDHLSQNMKTIDYTETV